MFSASVCLKSLTGGFDAAIFLFFCQFGVFTLRRTFQLNLNSPDGNSPVAMQAGYRRFSVNVVRREAH